MPVQIRVDDDVVILSNFGRLMNDPRHVDAGRDVGEVLDRGHRKFVIELRGVGEMGAGGIGLLVTITRLIRRRGGEAVLARPSRGMAKVLDEMKLDGYWETFEDVDEAKRYLSPGAD